jgi:hypothetical protein
MNDLNPRKLHSKLLAGLAVALIVTACGGGGGGGGDGDPDPDVVELDQPDDLMAALDDKVTSDGVALQQVVGDPPATNALTPKIEDIPDATAQPGSTVSLPINLSGDQDLSALFAKIPGAGSYFQANIAPGGKSRIVVPGKETVSFVFLTTVDFKVELPANLETGDRFCIEVKFRNTANDVGEPVQACINVVPDAPEAPANDQPSNAEFGSTLLGTWATNCFDIDSEDNTSEFKGAKLLLGFSSGKVFSESVALYGTSTCTGEASTAPFIDGVWNAGNAVFDGQSGRWLRPFDFNPNDPDPNIDFEPCYNVLSLNSAATQLYLGLPSTFSFDSGQAPVPGDCSAEDLRPTSVIVGLPFIKQ